MDFIRLLLLAVSIASSLGSVADEAPKLFPVKKGGKEGFIDNKGQIIVPLLERGYTGNKFSEGMLPVLTESGWAYLDESGMIKLDLGKRRYNYVFPFQNGLAAVQKGDRWGFIDKDGHETIKLQFIANHVEQSEERIILMGNYPGHPIQLLDLSGKVIVPTNVYSWIQPFEGGLALVKTNTPDLGRTKNGFIDRSGKVVVPLEYDSAFLPSEGIILARKSGIWHALDTNGIILFQGDFAACLPFSDGASRVQDPKSGKYGFIDRTGQWLIQAKFESCGSFSDGLAAFKTEGKWGFIDKTGQIVIPPHFLHVERTGIVPKCRGGLIQWHDGDKIGYTDRNGTWIWPLTE